jgi:phosphoribosylformylglycinamidine synthase
MTPYEMMLSESQERMLMVLHPEKEEAARAIFEKWELDFAVIGETIGEDRFLIEHEGAVKADLPLAALSGKAPEYDRPWEETPPAPDLAPVPEVDPIDALKCLLAAPSYAHKAWLWEQYDSQVMADTVQGPGVGAGIVRIHGTSRALAFTADVTPRYVEANPYEGGKQAVAEAVRNLAAVGATPLAVTDNLNFGNPEKPEIMGQIVGAIRGIGDACRALGTPVVSGNVSLYNETDGVPILPTPTIGAVGLIEDVDAIIGSTPRQGHVALVLGESAGHLGRSAMLWEVFNRADGDAPPVDLDAEARHASFIRDHRDWVTACTDISDGGLALAAFEMAERGGVGVILDAGDCATLFGEDQGRYLIACSFDKAEALMVAAGRAGVPLASVGRFAGDRVRFGRSEAPLAELSALWRGAFAGMMS